jgi:hypothetical protein
MWGNGKADGAAMSELCQRLVLELAPTSRGGDDSSKRSIEQAPQSRGNQNRRRLARAVAGGQGSRMTGLNVAKGFALPLVRPNSKNALAKLKDAELGSGSIHGDKFSFATDLSPASVCGTIPLECEVRTFADLVVLVSVSCACKCYTWRVIGVATADSRVIDCAERD